MEFGARARKPVLIADPTVPNVVEKLNNMIKHRDFWMPFAPAIMHEDAQKYLEVLNITGHISRYMMLGLMVSKRLFDTR